MSLEIIQADARHLPLADGSVQCIVTSPPYWGLRKYQGEQESVWGGTIGHFHLWTAERYYTQQTAATETREAFSVPGQANADRLKKGRWRESNTCECGAWKGAYGLEPTIELYIEHTVTILRELRRVLRKDGVLFWNIGDSYHNGDKGGYRNGRVGSASRIQANHLANDFIGAPNRQPQLGLKPKDLCLIPERVALAAQADGWWVRSRILWCKPNPMPESVTDRPTDAAEHIWMFTKAERYFWDTEAVREPAICADVPARGDYESKGTDGLSRPDYLSTAHAYPSTRNLRNVWTFPTQPYSGAHFATFPEEIPRRCILAATSAKGACAQCGAPWERVVEKKPATMNIRVRDAKRGVATAEEGYKATASEIANYGAEEMGESKTIGWQPTCLCRGQHGKAVPCVVLDPFAGSGTTGRVAIELNRRAILADIAYGEGDEYRRLAEERTTEVQRNLIGIEGVSV